MNNSNKRWFRQMHNISMSGAVPNMPPVQMNQRGGISVWEAQESDPYAEPRNVRWSSYENPSFIQHSRSNLPRMDKGFANQYRHEVIEPIAPPPPTWPMKDGRYPVPQNLANINETIMHVSNKSGTDFSPIAGRRSRWNEPRPSFQQWLAANEGNERQQNSLSHRHEDFPMNMSHRREDFPMDSSSHRREDFPMDSLPHRRANFPMNNLSHRHEDIPMNSSSHRREDIPMNSSSHRREDFPMNSMSQRREDFPMNSMSQRREDFPMNSLSQRREDFPMNSLSQRREDFPMHSLTQRGEDFPMNSLSQSRKDFPINSLSQRREDIEIKTQANNISKHHDPKLTVSITAKNYPLTKLTRKQMDLIQNAIIAKIVEQGDKLTVKPHFRGYNFHAGYLTINCENEATANWTKQIVPTLNPWSGASLSTMNGEPTKLTQFFRCIFPNAKSETTEQILNIVKAQNEGLSVNNWRLIKRVDMENNVMLLYAIDQQSAEQFEKVNEKIAFRFASISVKIKPLANPNFLDNNPGRSFEERKGPPSNNFYGITTQFAEQKIPNRGIIVGRGKKPIVRPSEKSNGKPIEKPNEKPNGKPIEKPNEKPNGKPIEKPNENPKGKPIRKPNANPNEKSNKNFNRKGYEIRKGAMKTKSKKLSAQLSRRFIRQRIQERRKDFF